MAACPDCHREMLLAPSCVAIFAVVARGKTFDRVQNPTRATDRCDSCYVKLGGIHHFGCDMEPCPSCGGQLITCTGSGIESVS